VLQARESFELSLETALLQDAVAPPAVIKGRIEETLRAERESYQNNTTGIEEDETPVRRMNLWKWMAAASVLLLLGTAFWAFSLYNRNKELQNVAQENSSLQNRLDQITAQLNTLKDDAAMLQKPGVRMAALKGTGASPNSYVTVYWDTTSKDAYLMINNLPAPASDQQYQLWALLDGKPVDMGVFNYEIRQEKLLVKTKGVQNAQAFAITLEPKGGSPNPTLEKMYVVGKL
jgi:anti-sigma-K factor RskA